MSGSALALGIALTSEGNVQSAIASTLLAGLCMGSSTVIYLAARETQSVSREYESLAMGWVNNIQTLAGFWSPLAFSVLVTSVGYAESWLVAAVYTFGLTSIIMMGRSKNTRSTNSRSHP
jgi:zinc transporter ZupT